MENVIAVLSLVMSFMIGLIGVINDSYSIMMVSSGLMIGITWIILLEEDK